MRVKVRHSLSGLPAVVPADSKPSRGQLLFDDAHGLPNSAHDLTKLICIRIKQTLNMRLWNDNRMPLDAWMNIEERQDRIILPDLIMRNSTVNNVAKNTLHKNAYGIVANSAGLFNRALIQRLFNHRAFCYNLCAMTEPSFEDIQIQDPPLQEFEKKTSCLRRSCFVALMAIAAILIGLLGIAWYVKSHRTVTVKKLPADLEGIPVYDEKNIERIAIERSWPGWIREWYQIIFSENLTLYSGNRKITKKITVEWDNLPASPSFIRDYYAIEFRKQSFEQAEAFDTKVPLNTWSKGNTEISIQITDGDHYNAAETDHVVMSILIR